MKYQVKEIKYTALVLDEKYINNILLTENGKSIVGRILPYIGSNQFNVIDLGKKYAFGCTTGAFTYALLLREIAACEKAVSTKKVEVLKPIKGGNPVTSPVVEESDSFFITESGKAYAKDKYIKSLEDVSKKEGAFGKFSYSSDDWGDSYYWWNSSKAGSSRKDILDSMYQAKAIIEFLEGKGDYAEQNIEEVVAESE